MSRNYGKRAHRLPLRPACPRHRKHRARGFTLIELMIAMVLGLIVTAGVISVFLAGQQSFRSNTALADVQDGSRIAFELMARDIREAGLTGCNSVNNRIANALSNRNTDWWAEWTSNPVYDNAVHGYDTNQTDPAVATGTGALQRVAGTDSLEIIGAGRDTVATSTLYDGTTAGFTLSAPVDGLQAGDIAVVCAPGQAAIFQANGYASGSTPGSTKVTFGATGYNDQPYVPNLLALLRPRCTPATATTYCFPANSLLSKLSAVDWYIGNNGNGSSLYRIGLHNVNGTPTPVAQEMIRNVTGMTITYLAPGIAGADTKFVPADTIAADNAWQSVAAVHVELTLESTLKNVSVGRNQPITRTYAFTTTLRNRVD